MVSLLLIILCTCFLPLKCHVELLVAVHDCVLCVVIISALFSPRPTLQYVLITIVYSWAWDENNLVGNITCARSNKIYIPHFFVIRVALAWFTIVSQARPTSAREGRVW